MHIHIIGIGGAGMSPVARILMQRGDAVCGSDQQESGVTDSLRREGATVYVGHTAEHVTGADLVVASAAIRPDNPELVAARQAGIRTISGARMLGELMESKRGICVAGTHGKTTTTAMITLALARAGLDPTYVIGGEPANLPASGRLGTGPHFVAEADEFGGRFLSLHPWIAVVTSIEADHPDCYPTRESLDAAFAAFVDLVPGDGWLVGCGDDPSVRELGRRSGKRFVTYGSGADNDWQATRLRPNLHGGLDFTIEYGKQADSEVRLRVPGAHNVSNALACWVTARLAGALPQAVLGSLEQFSGVRRRFEVIGSFRGATLIDDYAHHPTEIRATLSAARSRFPGRRIIALHQPHTFSRLKALLPDFAAAFTDADLVLITDVYPARETDSLGIHSRHLGAAMRHGNARYIGGLAEAREFLSAALQEGDVLISLGAGDVNSVLRVLLEAQANVATDTGGQ